MLGNLSRSYGGSQNIRLNPPLLVLINPNTSALTACIPVIFNFSMVSFIKRIQPKSLSTATIFGHPRLINSKEILPVPANKSKTLVSSKSMRLFKILKRAVLAKSVVGLTGKPLGGCSKRPLKFPPIMRNGIKNKVVNNGNWHYPEVPSISYILEHFHLFEPKGCIFSVD